MFRKVLKEKPPEGKSSRTILKEHTSRTFFESIGALGA